MFTGLLKGIAPGLILTALSAVPGAVATAADPHAGHGRHDRPVPDELGRVYHGMPHRMTAAQLAELRAKVPLYRGLGDAQISRAMDGMGPDYAWSVSPAGLQGRDGVLILTHGFGDDGDRRFREQLVAVGTIQPTMLGIGMAMMMSAHIQAALTELEDAGAERIVVVPVTSSRTNEVYRQWLYIFGRRSKAEFASVPRVSSGARLRFIEPPGDHPLIAGILLDRALEISEYPTHETVIIVGHGATDRRDNAAERKALDRLARRVKKAGNFAAVRAITLQDDAPPAVRAANVDRLRSLVAKGSAGTGRALVITNLVSERTIQGKIREDLKGLDYAFNPQGVASHANFLRWMEEGIRTALAGP